jgi:hypothetical protein
MYSSIRLKIFLVLILLLPACNSRYIKQNPDKEPVLRYNNNPIQEIRLINRTDTNLYYHYKASVSGNRPLFGDNNEFIRNFQYEELSSGQEIILNIKKGELLKIRYKKNKSEFEEKFIINEQKRIEVTLEGITLFKG